jgi:hypothetical protein
MQKYVERLTIVPDTILTCRLRVQVFNLPHQQYPFEDIYLKGMLKLSSRSWLQQMLQKLSVSDLPVLGEDEEGNESESEDE